MAVQVTDASTDLLDMHMEKNTPTSAPAAPKAFEPYIARFKDGVVEIVGRAGDTLLYIEVQVSQASQAAKVWVLGKVGDLKKKAEPYLGDLKKKAEPYLGDLKMLSSKLAVTLQEAKDKVGTTSHSLYAKIADGVIYVQGRVGENIVSFKAQASNTYALTYEEAHKRVAPVLARAKHGYMVTQEKLVKTASPYWLKAKDGIVYMQMQAGNTIVYIRTGASAAYSKAYKAIGFYIDPILQKAVAIYQQLNMKIRTTLEPHAQGLKDRIVDAKVAVLGVVARVRVRAVAAGQAAADFQQACYIKMKDGYVYIQGRVANTIVSIKVQLQEIARAVHVKMSKIRTDAQRQLLALTDIAKTKSAALGDKVRVAVNDREVQVTAASAVGGAAALGTSGGATGLVAGGAIGAACGVVPAVFTFGLSIPIGAALGGAAGLCMGTVAGGTVGLVGGGAAGRSAHKHRAEIKDGITVALTKANTYKDIVTEKASGCKDFVTEKAHSYKDIVTEKASDYKGFVAERTENVRARIVGGTGGTA